MYLIKTIALLVILPSGNKTTLDQRNDTRISLITTTSLIYSEVARHRVAVSRKSTCPDLTKSILVSVIGPDHDERSIVQQRDIGPDLVATRILRNRALREAFTPVRLQTHDHHIPRAALVNNIGTPQAINSDSRMRLLISKSRRYNCFRPVRNAIIIEATTPDRDALISGQLSPGTNKSTSAH